MKGVFSSIKKAFSDDTGPKEDEYLEIEGGASPSQGGIIVRPFVLNEYEDIKDIIDVLREGKTIALLNITPLKESDIVELKRAISKLKKTSEAIGGQVAGFGDDYIVAVPKIARVWKSGGSDGSELY